MLEWKYKKNNHTNKKHAIEINRVLVPEAKRKTIQIIWKNDINVFIFMLIF